MESVPSYAWQTTKAGWSNVSPEVSSFPKTATHIIPGALDSGAHGIIVPLLYTADDATRLVASAKFPPMGQRGFGSPFPMPCFCPSLTASEYLTQANSSLLTIVQIETASALENVDAIAAVQGIDVLFVGPFDLGNNIGRPIVDGVMHQELHDAIGRVLRASEAAGKKAGIFCTSGEQARRYAEMGFSMVSCATDMHVLPAALGNALREAKGSGEVVKMTGPYGK